SAGFALSPNVRGGHPPLPLRGAPAAKQQGGGEDHQRQRAGLRDRYELAEHDLVGVEGAATAVVDHERPKAVVSQQHAAVGDVVEGAVEEGGAGDGERVGGVGREPVEERERELAIEQQVGGDDQVVVLVPLQQPADLDREQRGG